MLRPAIKLRKSGEKAVIFRCNGVIRELQTSLIVAETYLGINPDLKFVIHLNDDKSDDTVENLFLSSTAEAVQDLIVRLQSESKKPNELFMKADYTNKKGMRLANHYLVSTYSKVYSMKRKCYVKTMSKEELPKEAFVMYNLGATTGGKLKVMAHRLCYWNFKGPIPDNLKVDHIDRTPGINHISNLRLAAKKENAQNKATNKAIKSPFEAQYKYLNMHESLSITCYGSFKMSSWVVRVMIIIDTLFIICVV